MKIVSLVYFTINSFELQTAVLSLSSGIAEKDSCAYRCCFVYSAQHLPEKRPDFHPAFSDSLFFTSASAGSRERRKISRFRSWHWRRRRHDRSVTILSCTSIVLMAVVFTAAPCIACTAVVTAAFSVAVTFPVAATVIVMSTAAA